MPSALGGFASGLSSGLTTGSNLRSAIDEREIARTREARAERQSAIAEEKGQLELKNARREQEYQEANKAFVDQWMNEKGKDGKPVEWTPQREFDYGAAKVKFDQGWGKLTAKDQLHFAEVKKGFDEREVKDAFGKLVAGDQKGAGAFLKKMGLKSAQIARDENGGWLLQGVGEDGNAVSMPAGVIGSYVGFPLNKALEDEADIEVKRSTAARNRALAGAAGTAARAVDDERALTRQGNEINKLFTTTENTLRQSALQLQRDEEKLDPNLSPDEKAAKKVEFAEKRRDLEAKAQRVFRDKADVSALIDSSKELKVNRGKGLSAARAHGILEEAAKGSDNIIIRDDNTAYYQMPGTKTLIPLEPGMVPQSVYDKRKKGAAPAQAPGGVVPPGAAAEPAAPARVVKPLAEREAEAARFNAAVGGGNQRRALPIL